MRSPSEVAALSYFRNARRVGLAAGLVVVAPALVLLLAGAAHAQAGQGAQQQMPQALPEQPLIDEKTVAKVPEPAN